jgi:hypothetical protein
VCEWRGPNGTTTGSVTDSGVSKCGGEPFLFVMMARLGTA